MDVSAPPSAGVGGEAADGFAARSRWRRGRRTGVFSALIFLLLGAYLFIDRPTQKAPRDRIRDAAPLDAGDPSSVSGPIEKGSTATMGIVFLLNRGGGPVEITRVRLVNPQGLSFVGAVLYPLNRPGQRPGSGPLMDRGYPPPGFTFERLDHPIPPSQRSPAGDLDPDFQILIGLRMESDTRATADAVEVHYRYQGLQRVARFPKSVGLCGAKIAYKDC